MVMRKWPLIVDEILWTDTLPCLLFGYVVETGINGIGKPVNVVFLDIFYTAMTI